jgi:predicted peroxiredoxin
VAKLLIITTTGESDDATLATVPFFLATGAGPGDEASVLLVGDAVNLLKPDVIANIRGVGIPPLRDVMDKCLAQNIPFHV